MFKKKCEKMFEAAGITVNGKDPWDMQVHSDRVFSKAILNGNLGLGETYLGGDWDCDRLDEFFYLLIKGGLDRRPYVSNILAWIKAWLLNEQKAARARQVGQRHYDLGNDLFKAMLDKTMSYSCGYWKEKTPSLELAQLNKLELICKKIHLSRNESVLDIGCGWGGFAKYAAAQYGAKVTGLTISEEQAKLARERCHGERIKILLEDYRRFSGKFDKIVSVGMFEHVGPKNYGRFMEIVNQLLGDSGIFLLHTIGCLKGKSHTDPWINKFIFPNGVIPSLEQIHQAAKGIFVALDEHEFGRDYDLTLTQWWWNFQSAWPELKKNPKYDQRFFRMWKYYLLSCAAAFRSGKLKLYQIVFVKPGRRGSNYAPIR